MAGRFFLGLARRLPIVCVAFVAAACSGGPVQAESSPTFELPGGILVPLGVPMETNATAEAANRLANEGKGTAAFRLRIALPGSRGEALTAKVQSLRVLPPERLLGEAGVGGAVALPGGPGWPAAETFVTLRRLDLEAGRLGVGFNLYESAETVLLIADSRASRSYRRQEASTDADEESQCRRCAWPSYLPDPASGAPELAQVREVLAGGPFLRAFLAVDPTASAAIRTATEGAIGFFRGQSGNYPLPIGWARVAAAAAPVPSPFQSSLAEPAQNQAIWNAGELGIAVSLAGGDLLLSATDHLAEGRALPFAFSRSYRSQSLGYGPLGSAGWSGNLFARLRENAITGEVEYHDGSGNVWRFFPPAADAGPGYELDPAGSYQVARGVYLRLQKLAGGGWRLIGRHHDTAEFDAAGRLLRISDRHRRGKPPEEQGNSIELRHDGLGQLVAAEDDLGRKYKFEYFEDPRPESQGGDGPRYGLLRRLVDFAGREVAYEFDAQRRLVAVKPIADGLSRAIEMPVPHPNSASRVAFQAEGIGGAFEHDAFGRVKQSRSGSSDPYEVSVVFKADARGKPEAGLPERVEQGAGRLWQAYEYDLQANVKRFKTSQGAEALADYDSWDRRVREKTGLADGRLQPIGNPQCSIAAAGSLTERAFDAAGHLARERRLQDFTDADGQLRCRWVESSYSYNLREQLIQVEQTHLSNPLVPGEVDPAARAVMRLEYDEFGRLQRHLALNSIDAAVETVFTYDPAGRAQGVQLGDGAAQTRAYDRKNRVVKTTDGDQAVWLGRYDVWDRLYWSRSPSGAFTRNIFDRAGHLTETAVFDRDPLGPEASEARLLASTRSHFTSFGEPDKVVEILAGEAGGERQILVTRREFDDAGRVKALWSGPALATAEEIDPEKKRRESETIYETGTGRVLEEWRGGYFGQPPLLKRRFVYETDNASPWPDRMAYFESVPGRPELVETASSAFKRDALGRIVEERRNDGSLVTTSYDRSSGNVLRVRSGADAVTSAAYDGAGRLIRTIRPNHRGETLSAYDLDGRLRQQRVITSAGEWVTEHRYDRSGRPIRTNYHDGAFAELTYNPDHTVATRRTRDGVLVSATYDAANRPLAQVPTREGTPAHQAPLDAGSFTSYDQLSRPTLFSRGSAGMPTADPALAVAYPAYDLGSRPTAEVVGARGPMSWQYDVYSRRQKLFLPSGPGRDAGSPFEGFSRQFDTLDRVADVSAIGAFSASTPGATWSWGGGRLYGMTTKSGLGTSLRLGYLGGEGPQLPVEGTADSKWKLGTLTWGAGAVDPTEMPATVWGQFGFGYRGKEGDPRDGAKIGRRAMEGAGLDLFSSLGWSWQFDAAARLTAAWPGRGDLEGRPPPEAGGFRYRYGQGDELESLIDEVAGTAVQTETGPYGRILGLGGVAFRYDPSGRRTDDDRFVYDWSWRSELMQVTVKDEWPNGQASPFAGHQVRYAYDAMGRLHLRTHYGGLPAGGGEGERPLIEKRVYVWEGQSLVAEAGYGDEAEQQPRWRKTYVPGPAGLDDAVQVLVENQAFPAQGVKLYTYLRDELGTVIGLVAEAESQDPSQPAIPARYRYTPYGEAQILPAGGPAPAAFESYRTAADTLGGRFPGGQTSLFQGLWTDPVTGIAYARARWYDARTATWLSEDPLLDIDSPNLYAFVGWSPAMATDPLGQCRMTDWQCWKWAAQEFGSNVANDADVSGTLKVVGGVTEMAAGVAGLATPEPTLVTKVAGWAALAHGTDVTASGLKELVSGQQQGTTTQQLATSAASTLGASEETAQTIGTSVDLAIGVASTAQSMRAASGLASKNTKVYTSDGIYPGTVDDVFESSRPSQLQITKLSQSTLENVSESAVKSGRTGATTVSRSLQSHASRPGSWLKGAATGNNRIDTETGRRLIGELVSEGNITTERHGVHGNVVRVRRPDGSGFWFTESGRFIGFLERYTRR